MLKHGINRRGLMTMAALVLLGGCQVIPSGGPRETGAPDQPSADTLPSDATRQRIALLVPLSGENAAVGQSIANAATMALLDTNAKNLRVTTYDTNSGAGNAASKAIADGNKLILGPLLSDHIPEVSSAARRAKVPVISFSNDEAAAGRNVFIMGTPPGQSVTRTVNYAMLQGIKSFGALVPRGEYGQRASSALMAAVRAGGGSVNAMETYDRASTSVTAAAHRLHDKGGFQAILIADGGRMASLAAPILRADTDSGEGVSRLLGTELWSGESVVTGTPALRGAWFAAVADTRFGQFGKSYKSRFGSQPYRIATLGYDAVLLTLRVSREWKPGEVFPTDRLFDKSGFLGLDGAFRFGRDGVIDRALELREVRAGGVGVISPAPARFQD